MSRKIKKYNKVDTPLRQTIKSILSSNNVDLINEYLSADIKKSDECMICLINDALYTTILD